MRKKDTDFSSFRSFNGSLININMIYNQNLCGRLHLMGQDLVVIVIDSSFSLDLGFSMLIWRKQLALFAFLSSDVWIISFSLET